MSLVRRLTPADDGSDDARGTRSQETAAPARPRPTRGESVMPKRTSAPQPRPVPAATARAEDPTPFATARAATDVDDLSDDLDAVDDTPDDAPSPVSTAELAAVTEFADNDPLADLADTGRPARASNVAEYEYVENLDELADDLAALLNLADFPAAPTTEARLADTDVEAATTETATETAPAPVADEPLADTTVSPDVAEVDDTYDATADTTLDPDVAELDDPYGVYADYDVDDTVEADDDETVEADDDDTYAEDELYEPAVVGPSRAALTIADLQEAPARLDREPAPDRTDAANDTVRQRILAAAAEQASATTDVDVDDVTEVEEVAADVVVTDDAVDGGNWWDGAVGYQIYLRSFNDSNGDGIGDIAGARARLDHLRWLGVDLVWLTPFYPSPQADHGYDVSDYTGVDPTYGSLDDFSAFCADAHQRKMKVIVDLVANHTSDQHPWFQAALAGVEHYRDYYVWRDPAPDGGPPNNWVSHFGGPAWTFDEASGQYYLHLFLPEQPDLNWHNPAVADEFDAIQRFWYERGVDGFRIDVAHAMLIDPATPDNPLVGVAPPADAHPKDIFYSYEHRYDLDQPGVVDIYRRWNELAAEHDGVLIGEVNVTEPEELTRYVADQDALHSAFCFPPVKVGWDADEIVATVKRCVDAGAGVLSWPTSTHDHSRAASRFGGGEVGSNRQLAFLTVLAAMPGIPFIYQGDELGLEDGQVDTCADPLALRNPGMVGRDGSRTPIMWRGDVPGFGFTSGQPWLNFGNNHRAELSVATQLTQPKSHLNKVAELLDVRRKNIDLALSDAPVTWLDAQDGVIAFSRGDLIVAVNTTGEKAMWPLPCPANVLYTTTPRTGIAYGRLMLPPNSAVWLARP